MVLQWNAERESTEVTNRAKMDRSFKCCTAAGESGFLRELVGCYTYINLANVYYTHQMMNAFVYAQAKKSSV